MASRRQLRRRLVCVGVEPNPSRHGASSKSIASFSSIGLERDAGRSRRRSATARTQGFKSQTSSVGEYLLERGRASLVVFGDDVRSARPESEDGDRRGHFSELGGDARSPLLVPVISTDLSGGPTKAARLRRFGSRYGAYDRRTSRTTAARRGRSLLHVRCLSPSGKSRGSRRQDIAALPPEHAPAPASVTAKLVIGTVREHGIAAIFDAET